MKNPGNLNKVSRVARRIKFPSFLDTTEIFQVFIMNSFYEQLFLSLGINGLISRR